jgi:integrase
MSEVDRHYDLSRRINSTLKNIEKIAKDGNKNAQLVLKYYRDAEVRQSHLIGLARKHIIIARSVSIIKCLGDENLQQIVKDHDEDKLLTLLFTMDNQVLKNGKPKSPASVVNEKIVLRKLVNYIEYGPNYFQRVKTHGVSDFCKFITTRISKEKLTSDKITEEDIVTEKELLRLIGACRRDDDRALLGVLFETGCRIGELCNIRFRDISYNPSNRFEIRFMLRGKSGIRKNNMIYYTRYLFPYLNSHPERFNKDAYLFPNLPKAYNKQLKFLATRAGISKYTKSAKYISGKKIHPHIFRHSSVSHKIRQGWSEQMIKLWHGWSRDSKMLSTYLHLSFDDVLNYNSQKGGLIEKEKVETFAPCDCGAMNHKDELNCYNCMAILDGSNLIKKDTNELLIQDRDKYFNLLVKTEIESQVQQRVKQVISNMTQGGLVQVLKGMDI